MTTSNNWKYFGTKTKKLGKNVIFVCVVKKRERIMAKSYLC
jgi:hypothetical protein